MLVPAYEYAARPAAASSVFAATRPAPDRYVLLVQYGTRVVGGCDWTTDDKVRGWSSFYGDLVTLDFAEAMRLVRDSFGGEAIRVRFVEVPRGYWVVGRARGVERATFVAHQGGFDDDPREDLYTGAQVLRYGAPHADGR